MRSQLRYYWQLVRPIVRRILPNPVSEQRGQQLHYELTCDATWNTNYVVFIISSCAIATFGLIANSTAVIIGAMLIAPLMMPLRALAFAALEGDLNLFRRAFFSIFGGTVIAIALSCLIGSVTPIPSFGSEFQSRVQPNLVDLGIAIAAGGISGFAKIREGVSDALAGTAIAVALMPPLCVVGLALSRTFVTPGFGHFSQQAFLLYLTNLLGIILACMTVYILAGYTEVSHSVTWAMVSVAVLLLPLGANFLTQVRQARVEDFIRSQLLRNTFTIGQQDVTLVDSRIDWGAQQPIVYLNVQVAADIEEDISPNQVRQVQRFLSQQVGQPLKLVVFVSQGQTVTEEGVNQLDATDAVPFIDPNRPLLPKPATEQIETIILQEEANEAPEKTFDEAMPTQAPE
ncbi:MAG: DUF389 domain-containing protein [Spirulina sp. SIO3F2]|nr:DUF389 domain-containing protein [Spirulina sp. SIO3F2]